MELSRRFCILDTDSWCKISWSSTQWRYVVPAPGTSRSHDKVTRVNFKSNTWWYICRCWLSHFFNFSKFFKIFRFFRIFQWVNIFSKVWNSDEKRKILFSGDFETFDFCTFLEWTWLSHSDLTRFDPTLQSTQSRTRPL